MSARKMPQERCEYPTIAGRALCRREELYSHRADRQRDGHRVFCDKFVQPVIETHPSAFPCTRRKLKRLIAPASPEYRLFQGPLRARLCGS
jgi:hypothetical protein